jgi:AcrR family transcriptional regulator
MGGRERILQAAGEVFDRSPFAEASIAPILATAGVQPPTLYHHFGDKEGLYVAWAQHAFSELIGRFNLKNASLTEGLAGFAMLFFIEVAFDIDQVLRDIPTLGRHASQEAVYGAYFQALYEPLLAVFIEAMERGELSPESVGPIADIFLAGLFHLKKNMSDGQEATSARWYAERFVRGFGRR